MEHRLILGGEQYLPFARSRIKALRATGLEYATQRFIMPGGETVRVQIVGDHEYIELNGGIYAYSVGIEGNRIVARHGHIDNSADWKTHSTLADAHAEENEYSVPFSNNSKRRFSTISPRSEVTPGADAALPRYRFVDGFGQGVKIYAGPKADYLAGLFWAFGAWVISTDGDKGTYLFTAVATDNPDYAGANYQTVIWKCEHVEFKTGVKTAKPTMWAFPYDVSDPLLLGYGLHTSMSDNVVYVGNGRFVYGLGGAAQANGNRIAGEAEKMVIVVTESFDTFTAYDVETGLGGLYGPNQFALGGCCYIGNGLVLFGGYGTTDMIVFNSATGAMTRRYTYDPSSPWLTTRAVPMPMGDDSACYWEYDPGATALNDGIAFTYTTDQGVNWSVPTMSFVDQSGAAVAVDYYLGTTTVRKPLVKDGATITFDGELGAVFHVAGEGHYEFRTTNKGATWVRHGLISATAATTGIGLIFRHVLYGDPKLSRMWG